MRRVTVTEKDVILPFAILMPANFILMLAWSRIDPLVWIRTEPDEEYKSYGDCTAEGQTYIVFLVLIAVVNASALILANIQAFKGQEILVLSIQRHSMSWWP